MKNMDNAPLVTGAWRCDCENAGEINRDTLMTILRENRDTEFGRKYGFAGIADADAYRRTVPIMDYEDYAEDIMRMRAGETNILTAYPLYGYANTSGTSGGSRKWIPFTLRRLEIFGEDPDRYVTGILKEKGGKRLYLSVFRTNPDEPFDGLVITGIYYRYRYLSGRMDMDSYVGGRELFFDRDPGDVLFAKAYSALTEKNITVMESVFQYDYLQFFTYIETHWKELLDVMRTGKIPEEIVLSDSIRRKLSSLPVTGERIRELETEFQKGFEGIAGRIWPGLSALSGVSNPAFFAEEEKLIFYVGGIARNHYAYAASECYFGNAAAENCSRYAMMPRHKFFEFLPCDSNGNDLEEAQTVLPEETEIGKLYELIITNYGGLYRYRMNDIIRVVDFCGQSPIVEFVMRRGMALNIDGEKVTLHQIEESVRELKNAGIEVETYCFTRNENKIPGRYLAALVLKAGSTVKEEEVSARIDASLKRQNWDYEDLRNMNALAAPDVRFLSMEAYQKTMERSGLTAGQSKPKHIAPNGLILD